MICLLWTCEDIMALISHLRVPVRIPHGCLWVGTKPQGPAAQSWAFWEVSVTGLFPILALQSTSLKLFVYWGCGESYP